MSRTQQDQFIDDDEEETCPLCVEEFDLSDRGFRPCPCGYQICQFCYHNVRTNMNGLCPACRRRYDDATIVFSKPSPEEEIAWKARQAAKQKKNTIAAQKEAQKREADTLSRKHLAGLRVVQKNLVYVTGLSPSVQEDRLLETLRGPSYFGQYGKIVKIVVSKAKEPHTQSVGVYVTYARKSDAAMCIQAVDGSQNGDRVLRAQFGTTKYCSAYLRNEQCTNRNCMFLHEPGEDNESFTRQDLSSMNVYSTQQPSSEHSPPQPPPPVVPVAAAHTAIRQEVNDTPQSLMDDPDRPALPSTASWASRPPQMSRQQSSAGRSVAAHHPSPIVAAATPKKEPVKPEPVPEPVQEPVQESAPSPKPAPAPASTPQSQSAPTVTAKPAQPPPLRQRKQPPASAPLVELFKSFVNADFKFDFSTSRLTEQELDSIRNFPALFDENGGAKRRALKLREEEERRRLEQEAQLAMQAAAAMEAEEHEEARGSLQLGGEPEEPEDAASQQHNHIANDMSAVNVSRQLTPQQHQQLLLQQLKAPSVQNQQPSFPHQTQSGNPPGHARNVSRYTFANDTPSASASVKPVANSKLMNQQSSMMPPQANMAQQPPAGFFSSNVQGPPPGLKTTGTPPFSGGGMFGQGHGFATSGLGYGANVTGRSPNDELMRDLLRNRNLGGGGGASQVSSDAGKRGGALSAVDVSDPSILQARLHQAQAAGHNGGQGLAFAGQGAGQEEPGFHLTGLGFPPHLSPDLSNDVRVGTPGVPPGFEGMRTPGLEGLGQAMSHSGVNSPILGGLGLTGLGLGLESPRRATPMIPPGFTAEHLSQPPSRSASRASMKLAKGSDKEKVLPAIPVLPGSSTPVRAGTPLREVVKIREREEHATPTKAGKKSKAKKLESALTTEVEQSKVTPEEDSTAGAEKVDVVEKEKTAEPEKKEVKLTRAERQAEKQAAKQAEKLAEKLADEQKKAAEKEAEQQAAMKAAPAPAPVIKDEEVSPPKSAAQMLAEKHAQTQQAQAAPSQAQAPLTAAQLLEQRHRKAEVERAASGPGSRAPSPVRSQAPSPSPVKDDKKRQQPGKLDISAAVSKPFEAPTRSESSTPAPSSATLARPGAVIKTLPMPAVAPSRSGTPVSSTTEAPAKRVAAPRTLRVVSTPTPKAETPPQFPALSEKASHEIKSALPRLPSRQPSLASINMPGTPLSEKGSTMISDNMSVTSTSFSRASSPPPGPVGTRVGSAPVRAKTKNQQKKDRQERARQIEEEKVLAAEAEREAAGSKESGSVQEAIMGRKKKVKKPAAPKEKVQNQSQASTPKLQSQQGTPVQSRPGTPKIGTIAEAPAPAPVSVPAPVAAPAAAPPVADKVEELEVATPEPQQVQPEPESMSIEPEEPEQQEGPPPRSPSPQAVPAPVLTPQSIIADLRASSSPLLSSSLDTLFRPLAQQNNNYKPSQPLTPHDLGIPRSLERNPDVNIKGINLDYMWQHNSGLRYGGEDGRMWSRGCVTPGGAHLRHLEEPLEERFLHLEKEVRQRGEHLKFWAEEDSRAGEIVTQLLASVSTSQNSAAGAGNTAAGLRLEDEFPRIDLVKLKKVLEEFERYGGRRDANAMEKAVEEGSKKGSFLVDTAGKYVNEFVLPTFGAPGGISHSEGGVGPSGQAVGVGAGGFGATSAVAKLGPGTAVLNGDEGGAVQDYRGQGTALSVAEAERMLAEAKKVLEEREAQLRKVVKRNRKLVGLTH